VLLAAGIAAVVATAVCGVLLWSGRRTAPAADDADAVADVDVAEAAVALH